MTDSGVVSVCAGLLAGWRLAAVFDVCWDSRRACVGPFV